MARATTKPTTRSTPSPTVVAEVHTDMLKSRKGLSLDRWLEVVADDDGYFWTPAEVDQVCRFYFLSFRDPDGHSIGRMAITADEAAHPRLVGLMQS